MQFFEVRTPFFRPLWRRILAAAIVLGWAVFELVSGAVFWGALFGVAGAYVSWQFFVTFEDGPAFKEAEKPKDAP